MAATSDARFVAAMGGIDTFLVFRSLAGNRRMEIEKKGDY